MISGRPAKAAMLCDVLYYQQAGDTAMVVSEIAPAFPKSNA